MWNFRTSRSGLHYSKTYYAPPLGQGALSDDARLPSKNNEKPWRGVCPSRNNNNIETECCYVWDSKPILQVCNEVKMLRNETSSNKVELLSFWSVVFCPLSPQITGSSRYLQYRMSRTEESLPAGRGFYRSNSRGRLIGSESLQQWPLIRVWNLRTSRSGLHYSKTYYAPAPRAGGIKRWCVSDVCLSRTSGLSREQRGLGRLGTEAAHVTRDSDTSFKVKTSKDWQTTDRRQTASSLYAPAY